MKRILGLAMSTAICFALLITAVASLADSSQPHSNPSEGIEGIWLGTLNISGMELRIVFRISQKPDGTLTATMDSPDQGLKDIPVDEITFENGNLHLEVKSVLGAFEGNIKGDRLTIDGQWKQAGTSWSLVLKHVEKVPEIRRPQEPEKPYPYQEEEAIYENKKAGVKLAGTLTLPYSGGPFPAVLLISGSGAQDRDETILGHKPFLVLADYLTRRGIAVLRVDDRGIGGSTGDLSQATSKDFAGDVLAGIDYLKGRKEIDPNKIGLIGHSEGGLIAPMVAARSPDVAFIVMMAGPGLTGEEILYLQGASILKTEGVSDKAIAQNHTLQERMFSVLKQEEDSAIAEEKLHKIMVDALAEMGKEEKQELNLSEASLESQIQFMLSPWYRYFLTYDPRPALMKVKCPVLAINGEKDLQVPPEENLQAVEEALKAGGNEHYTIEELPSLNHLFQTAETGSLSEYGKIEETISLIALKIIADWILEQDDKS
jgi:hypothetical protein